MSDITLYFARASRAFVPLWLLEELDLPYRLKRLNLNRGDQKTRPYVALNPMGKVPTLTDGEAVVTENPAICLYLAVRYGYGTLAPRIEAPERAAYLRWTVFATAVAEPSIYSDEPQDPIAASGRGWGDKASVLAALRSGPDAGTLAARRGLQRRRRDAGLPAVDRPLQQPHPRPAGGTDRLRGAPGRAAGLQARRRGHMGRRRQTRPQERSLAAAITRRPR